MNVHTRTGPDDFFLELRDSGRRIGVDNEKQPGNTSLDPDPEDIKQISGKNLTPPRYTEPSRMALIL